MADGRVDCVVTYKLDRLSRNLVDTVTLVRQEWAGRCIYRSATEGFDTSHDSPTGALVFNILASFAEFERAGAAAVTLVGAGVFAMQVKLPYKKVLIVTGVMIGAVLLTMAGKSVHAMQVVGWHPTDGPKTHLAALSRC